MEFPRVSGCSGNRNGLVRWVVGAENATPIAMGCSDGDRGHAQKVKVFGQKVRYGSRYVHYGSGAFPYNSREFTDYNLTSRVHLHNCGP